jgi:hypothetical protein
LDHWCRVRPPDVVEPRPHPSMAASHPDAFARLSAEPAFLLVAAEARS